MGAILERDQSISQFINTQALEHFRNLSITLIPVPFEYPFCMRIKASVEFKENKTNRFHFAKNSARSLLFLRDIISFIPSHFQKKY